MSYARASLETVVGAAAALLAAGSFEAVARFSAEFAKASLERLIERSAKLSEMRLKLAAERTVETPENAFAARPRRRPAGRRGIRLPAVSFFRR